METVDYLQTVEDHQTFLVLIRPTGKLLAWKHFSRCWDRIAQLNCVMIPGQKREMWLRYKRNYSKESNEWGDFQAHRKALGLISVGKCSNDVEFQELFESYKLEKEKYSDSLYNSRLIVFGMNTDGTEISHEQQRELNEEESSPPTFKIDPDEPSDSTISSVCDSDASVNSTSDKSQNGHINIDDTSGDPLRRTNDQNVSKNNENASKSLTGSNKVATEKTGSQITFLRPSPKNDKVEKLAKTEKESLSRNSSSGSIRDLPGSEVVFYTSIDNCEGLEEGVKEFVTSLFFVLEGKRLDRSFERADKSVLLLAPFEKKDFVGVDTDTKSYKKKCQGRLKKHLGDLCLLAGLSGEAMLHYSTAVDILKPVNDWLWMAACYEGICASSVISAYKGTQTTSIRRNQSFSVKRGVTVPEKQKPVSTLHSYSNGLQELPDLPSKSGLNADDIVEKYKDALMYYSKFKSAAVIEMEASFKACRILILHRKYLQASDFLQNVVYINLQLTDEDRINRYSTLSTLYAKIGFRRKASFFKRVAAMQCVAPQNPKPNWTLCHQLLVQALEGYRIHLDQKDSQVKSPGQMNGWPVVQMRVLHELIYSARRMGNMPLAIRYMTILLYTQLEYMTIQEKRDLVTNLVNFTGQNEGTTQPLALDSGVIIPHVPLLNIPFVKSFKVMPLTSHLEPRKLQSVTDTSSDSVFIFTPLNLGATRNDAVQTDMDFQWVEGDMSEVQLLVDNIMPDELTISQITLICEGIEIESFPLSPKLPAEASSYLIKIIVRPLSTGTLKILGYSTKVLGVRSNCKLRDCPTIPQTYFNVKVIPALPEISLTSSLPKSASFLSFGEEFNIVTSAAAVLYNGQSSECIVTLQNNGKLPVELVNISLESSRDNKEFVNEVFKWNQSNIESQLPLQISGVLCFNLVINAVGEYLLKNAENIKSYDLLKSTATEGKVVEAVLKVEYSGGAGLQESYCRCSSIGLCIDILPSIVFHKWDVTLSESQDHCYLLFDIQNISDEEIQVKYSKQCITLKNEQIKRIFIEIERCEPTMFKGKTSEEFSQFLSNFVDISWFIPSMNINGRVGIESLKWSQEQQQLFYLSPVSWVVKLDGQVISPLHIGSLEYRTGKLIRIDVDVSVNTESLDIDGREVVLTMCCCQDSENDSIIYNTEKYVSVIGSQSLFIPKFSSDGNLSHSCLYMFLCSGFYKFEILMIVKGQGHDLQSEGNITKVKGHDLESKGHISEVKGHDLESKGHITKVKGHDLQGEGHIAKVKGQNQSEIICQTSCEDSTYKCSSVIEVNIID
ncbi:Trafficking protein particle complex subunit 9 [Mactra antiquata]